MSSPFPTGLIIVFVAITLVLLWMLITYNRLINLRNLIHNSWSNVETELKRRYDLIPNLVKTVSAYAKHERDVLERLTVARSQCVASAGPPDGQAKDENILVGALRQVFAVVENYPDLKANANFLALQDEFTNTEDRIQSARRYYNGNIKDYNNLVQMVPSNFIASFGNFQPESYFEIEDSRQRVPVEVTFL